MPSTRSGSIRSTPDVLEAGLPAAASPSSRSNRPAGSEYLKFSCSGGARRGTIEFQYSLEDHRLALAQQDEFKSDFCQDLAQIEEWAADRHWPASPTAEFRIAVSDRFRISKSLFPAWSGRAGSMEFPTWRVIARKAAIAHELAHVFFPNGNRLLAEGLAVYLQAELGGNPAFPNFGQPLHKLARERLWAMMSGLSQENAANLELIHLAELDAIATPRPLMLRIGNDWYGEEPRGQAHLYPIAGSFIQFLIETRGLTPFRDLYESTPLVPLQQNSGSPDRWTKAYGSSLSYLESEWKSMITGMVKS